MKQDYYKVVQEEVSPQKKEIENYIVGPDGRIQGMSQLHEKIGYIPHGVEHSYYSSHITRKANGGIVLDNSIQSNNPFTQSLAPGYANTPMNPMDPNNNVRTSYLSGLTGFNNPPGNSADPNHHTFTDHGNAVMKEGGSAVARPGRDRRSS